MPYDNLNIDFLVNVGGTYKKYNFSTIAELVQMTDGTSVQAAIDSIMTDMDATQHVIFVADIDARDELTPKIGDLVYVIDASDDSTVTEGWAKYLWEGTEWLKTAEGESLDVSLNWADILGKPSSTVSQIDAAVANSHTHTNKTDLDKFSEADSVLQYDGVPVQLGPLVVVSADEPTDQPESGIWLRPIETIIED